MKNYLLSHPVAAVYKRSHPFIHYCVKIDTMTSAAPESNVASYLLTLRSERPVECCELSPNAFLSLKGGNLDNSGRAKLLDSKPFHYVFTWHRGPQGRICANQRCTRGHSFAPTDWSKAVTNQPHLQCNVCLHAGGDGHDATFCSSKCFKDAWREHTQVHKFMKLTSPTSCGDLESPSTPTEDDALLPVVNTPSTSNHSLHNRNTTSLRYTAESIPEGWTLVSTDKEYLPSAEDVGCRLRVQVTAEALADGEVLAGPVAIFTDVVLQAPSAPPKRNLLAVPGAQTAGNAFRFRIISYNILAELFATKQAYPYCDSWSLSWPYRRAIILQELQQTSGDVICLQEVQADYYEAHILPFMSDLGYDGLFLQKTRDFTGSYVKVDGCATFWRRSKFTLSESYSIEFNDIARQEVSRLNLDEAEARKYMNRLSRDNVAQIVVLDASVGMENVRNNRNCMCFVNTHLYSNVTRADVKLWQTVNLLREVRQFVVARDLPVMLCGDFNSEPESAVYEFIMSGMITSARPELHHTHHAQAHSHPENNANSSNHNSNSNGNSNGNVRILPDLHRLSHDLDLTSIMHTTLGHEPSFTNYTQRFKGTLDYIYYSPARFRVLSVAPLPEEHDLRKLSGEGLPSACYPSDHLMLCADVALVTSGNGSILNTEMGSRHINVPSMMRAHNSTSNLTSASSLGNTSSQYPIAGGMHRNYSSPGNLHSGMVGPSGGLLGGSARK